MPIIFKNYFHSTNQVQQTPLACFVHRFGDSSINYIEYNGVLYDEKYFVWNKFTRSYQPVYRPIPNLARASENIQNSFCWICQKPLSICPHGGAGSGIRPFITNVPLGTTADHPRNIKNINTLFFIILCIYIFIAVIAIIIFIYIPLMPDIYIDIHEECYIMLYNNF